MSLILDLIFCLFIFSGVHLLEAHVPQDIPDRIHCLLAFEIMLSPFPTDDLQHHYERRTRVTKFHIYKKNN